MIDALFKIFSDVLSNNKKEEEKECCCCDNHCDNCCCDSEYECICNDEPLDLTDENDYKKFNDTIESIREDLKDSNLKPIYEFLLGGDAEEALDTFKYVAKSLRAEGQKPEKKVPELPSSKLNVSQKEQIHKIVAEYVDTVIKPNTDMDKNVINDVYAGLFEFACWILNK